MAIARGPSNSGIHSVLSTGTSTISGTYNSTNALNSVLVVIYESTTPLATNAVSDGVNTWSFVAGQSVGTFGRLEVWTTRLAGNGAGQTLIVTLPSAVNASICMNSFSGLDATTPIVDVTSASGTGTAATGTWTPSDANGWGFWVNAVREGASGNSPASVPSPSAGTPWDSVGFLDHPGALTEMAATYPAVGSICNVHRGTAVTSTLTGSFGGPSLDWAAIVLTMSTITVAPPSPPTAPVALTFTGITYNSIGVVIPALAGGATSYSLQRAPDVGGTPGAWATIVGSVSPSATYTDGGGPIKPLTSYWYRLIATNSGGSTNGVSASAVTIAIPIPAISGFGLTINSVPANAVQGT